MRAPATLLALLLILAPVLAFEMNGGETYTVSTDTLTEIAEQSPVIRDTNLSETNETTGVIEGISEVNEYLVKTETFPAVTKEESTNIPVVVEGTPREFNMEEIERVVRKLYEKNLERVEERNVVAEKVGEQVWIRKTEKIGERMEEIPEKVREMVDRVAEKVGVELAMPLRGPITVREMKGHKVVVKVVMPTEENAVVGKVVEFDAEKNEAEVNILVTVAEPGIYYVEENIPKGEGAVELNLTGKYVVIEFDPVVAWVVELNAGEEASVSYRVKADVPPELEPAVARLAECDVKVEVVRLVRSGDTVSGEFRILFGGAPVYTPDVRVNGETEFVRDGMYYVFQGRETPVVVEGSVGDCSFYREITVPQDYTPFILGVLGIVALVAIAWIWLRG